GISAAYSLPPVNSGASTSVYQPPAPGQTSTTVICGLMPKNSNVSSGCRYGSRARFSAERCSPASTFSMAAAVTASRGGGGGDDCRGGLTAHAASSAQAPGSRN